MEQLFNRLIPLSLKVKFVCVSSEEKLEALLFAKELKDFTILHMQCKMVKY